MASRSRSRPARRMLFYHPVSPLSRGLVRVCIAAALLFLLAPRAASRGGVQRDELFEAWSTWSRLEKGSSTTWAGQFLTARRSTGRGTRLFILYRTAPRPQLLVGREDLDGALLTSFDDKRIALPPARVRA